MLIINCKSISTSTNNDEMVDKYFADIRKYKKLTHEEQKELLYKIKNGNGKESEKARKELIEGNQRIIASVARKLSKGDDFTDLVSEGTIGLNKAIDKFNLGYGQNFITYAIFWITKYMIEYIIEYRNIITPKNANKVYSYVSAANNKFFLENCRYPTIEELQQLLENKEVMFPKKEDLIQHPFLSLYCWMMLSHKNHRLLSRTLCLQIE